MKVLIDMWRDAGLTCLQAYSWTEFKIRKQGGSMMEVGDRIRALGHICDSIEDMNGKLGTIIDIVPEGAGSSIYSIEFDDPIRAGHKGYNSNGREGHCRNTTNSSEFEVIGKAKISKVVIEVEMNMIHPNTENIESRISRVFPAAKIRISSDWRN